MNSYTVLLRGVNVGGKNKVPMVALKDGLERLGFSDVSTYLVTGNIHLRSTRHADDVGAEIEAFLPRTFRLDDEIVKVLVLTRDQLQSVINRRPDGFADFPDKYHSDAIFLMGIDPTEAMSAFSPRPGVDEVWLGDGVIYSQRLSAQRTKSRLNRIMESPLYKSMTIRSWSTTTKLLNMGKAESSSKP